MLYLAIAGVNYEGSGVIGIFNTEAEAMSFVENSVERFRIENNGFEYCDNYWECYAWDMDKQKYVTGSMKHYSHTEKVWE